MKSFLKIFLIVFFVVVLAYTVNEISKLANRIERIENKLGGSKKIACNEKDTVERVRRSVVRIVGGEGEGSGFAFKEGGLILTNFHVIEFEPSPKVVLPDNTFETAEVVMADKDSDLAVIKIRRKLPVVTFSCLDEISPAEEILAIGYPLGGIFPGEPFVARGSFSRKVTDKENNVKYLVTDMTMIEGMSGGPMVNICGEVLGISTMGLYLGGLSMAVLSDSIQDKYQQMSVSENPLKDAKKVIFEPDKNALEAVRAFYNYLKVRRLDKAFELQSDNYVKGYSFEHFAKGYRNMLDTSVVIIKRDKEVANRINVKLSTKDLVGDEIVYKYFEGYWDVRQVDGKWLLWDPEISEVNDPGREWFADLDMINEIKGFLKANNISEEYGPEMYGIWQEPGNEDLSLQDLYDKVKKEK
jgi:hypothetical protein